MKRFVFAFSWQAGAEAVYLFTLDGPQAAFDDWDLRYDTQHLLFMRDMEQYGVHDYGTTGDDEFVGYYTYEIDPADWDTVVEKWHSYMAEQGFTTGAVEKMSREDYQAKYF
jgi:hypothetical protein